MNAVLEPAGLVAAETARLWWVLLWAGTAVFAVVTVALIAALQRGKRRALRQPRATADVAPEPAAERRTTRLVGASAGLTALIVAALIVADAATSRRLRALHDDAPLTISVIGHQWWWEVTYDDSLPSRAVTTANELVLPLGRPVRLLLQSRDVGHSFWAPGLAGAQDLVPGRPATLWLRADRPGTFAGRCAEYCGLQHAHMGFTVTVVTPLDFYAWLDSARAPAREPATASQARGRDAFVAGSCALCHTIRGTEARATVGPDLTHVASRPTLAAGALPYNRGTLAGWIVNPAHIKPGAAMPAATLPAAELRALLDYLASLR